MDIVIHLAFAIAVRFETRDYPIDQASRGNLYDRFLSQLSRPGLGVETMSLSH